MDEEKIIEAPLIARLAELEIPVDIHRHPPLNTVAESQALRGEMQGSHIKNLFLRDKKRNKWLVTVLEDAIVDLKELRNKIGASGNLSFGNAELLYQSLGVRPGAVTPFAVMNNTKADTKMVLARDVLANDYINAHPLHNRATASILSSDLLKFLIECGYPPIIIELP